MAADRSMHPLIVALAVACVGGPVHAGGPEPSPELPPGPRSAHPAPGESNDVEDAEGERLGESEPGAPAPAPDTVEPEPAAGDMEQEPASPAPEQPDVSARTRELDELRKRTKAAEEETARVRSAYLIQYGVSAGVALAIHTPFVFTDGFLESVGVGAMPYLLLLPGYWGPMGPARAYCASHWTRSAAGDGAQAAEAAAERRAAKIVDAILAYLTVEQVDADHVGQAMADEINRVHKIRGRDKITQSDLRYAASAILAQKDRGKRRDASEVLVRRIAGYLWNRTRASRCVARKLGLWVGRSTGFKGQVSRYDEDDITKVIETKEKIRPVVSFGLAFVPTAYASILAGVTNAKWSPKEADGDDLGLWMFTIGVGLNLDLVTLLATR